MESVSLPGQRTEALVGSYVRSVYNWMCLGLALTGFIAYSVSTNETILQLVFGNPIIFLVLILAELALVFSVSAFLDRLSSGTATFFFVLYSALNGLTLSVIFLAYAHATIFSTFLICAGTFLACSIFGWTTKRDLTSLGGFLFMGLMGIIIASVVNMFILNDAATMIISYIGVLVFVGLTAYDTQNLKNMALTQPSGADAAVIRKAAIWGALRLYLDFINLFLLLLRIFGGSRD